MKHKAFINAKSRVGFTALHLAATKGFTKLCLFLIQEHGASVDAVTLVSLIIPNFFEKSSLSFLIPFSPNRKSKRHFTLRPRRVSWRSAGS